MIIEAPAGNQVAELTHKSLISNELWGRMTRRLARDKGYSLAIAERNLDRALGFLWLCGQLSNVDLSPTEEEDDGWHVFLHYTRDYAEFCHRVCGRFIHHNPSDVPGVEYHSPGDALSLRIAAMEQHNISVAGTMPWLVDYRMGVAGCSMACQGVKCCSSGERP